MDQNQILEQAMWTRTLDCLSTYSVMVTPLADVAPLVSALYVDVARFKALAVIHAAGTGAYAAAKKQAIADAAAITTKWGRRCSIHAHALGMYALEDTINHRPYEITELGSTDAYNKMVAIRDMLQVNILSFAGQGLAQANINTMTNLLAVVAGLLEAPKEAQNGKEVLTGQMKELQVKIDGGMDAVVMLLEAEYEDTNPDFVSALLIAHEKGRSTAHRYTGITGKAVMQDGKVATGYKILCMTMPGKTATTDIQGHYTIRTMRPGIYIFELRDAADKLVEEYTLRIKQGQTMVKDWVI